MDRVSIHKELHTNRKVIFPEVFQSLRKKYEWETSLGGLSGKFTYSDIKKDKRYIKNIKRDIKKIKIS